MVVQIKDLHLGEKLLKAKDVKGEVKRDILRQILKGW